VARDLEGGGIRISGLTATIIAEAPKARKGKYWPGIDKILAVDQHAAAMAEALAGLEAAGNTPKGTDRDNVRGHYGTDKKTLPRCVEDGSGWRTRRYKNMRRVKQQSVSRDLAQPKKVAINWSSR